MRVLGLGVWSEGSRFRRMGVRVLGLGVRCDVRLGLGLDVYIS